MRPYSLQPSTLITRPGLLDLPSSHQRQALHAPARHKSRCPSREVTNEVDCIGNIARIQEQMQLEDSVWDRVPPMPSVKKTANLNNTNDSVDGESHLL